MANLEEAVRQMMELEKDRKRAMKELESQIAAMSKSKMTVPPALFKTLEQYQGEAKRG